jgi:hypothetical protein
MLLADGGSASATASGLAALASWAEAGRRVKNAVADKTVTGATRAARRKFVEIMLVPPVGLRC